MTAYRDKLLSLSIGPKGDKGRGISFQLPKTYPHAKKRDGRGNVVWTTKQEARDIASRAQDHGESVHYDW